MQVKTGNVCAAKYKQALYFLCSGGNGHNISLDLSIQTQKNNENCWKYLQ